MRINEFQFGMKLTFSANETNLLQLSAFKRQVLNVCFNPKSLFHSAIGKSGRLPMAVYPLRLYEIALYNSTINHMAVHELSLLKAATFKLNLFKLASAKVCFRKLAALKHHLSKLTSWRNQFLKITVNKVAAVELPLLGVTENKRKPI